MEARQAKLVFAGFIGLAAAISFNALYMQSGPHPAPLATEDGRISGPAATAGKPAKTDPVQAERTRIKAIQRELTAKGYDPGPVDAVMGFFTRAAIMAYESDNQLPVAGEPTAELLEHLVLGVSLNPVSEPAEPPSETVALVKAVQQILADQGYGPGAVDGVPGEETRAAIKSFEKDRGLRETGRISGKLLRKIIGATGARITTSSID